jgi:hypothetical protein
VIRHNRLLVAFYVITDSLLGLSAFILAYVLRFQTGLIPVTKGIPPLRQYVDVLPFIGVLVPLGFHLQGLYRLRRGRSRVDDFFAVFVGSILAVIFGIMATTYTEIYLATNATKDTGSLEVSQAVWAIFLVLNFVLTFSTRELMREVLERRWRAPTRFSNTRSSGIRSSDSSTICPTATISATAACRSWARSTRPPRSPSASRWTICMWRCRPNSTST